jgi:hypothetical protein
MDTKANKRCSAYGTWFSTLPCNCLKRVACTCSAGAVYQNDVVFMPEQASCRQLSQLPYMHIVLTVVMKVQEYNIALYMPRLRLRIVAS